MGVLLLAALILFSFMVVSAQSETTNDTFTDDIDTSSSEFDDEFEGEDTEVSSQSEADILSEVESEYEDEQLGTEAGTTPDSALYFIDEFFDQFSDDLDVREEKIAEIREMVKQGNIEEARKALDSYLTLAEKLGAESDPEKRDDTRRSAAAIRNAVSEFESEIPERFREEFVDDVLEKEAGIITAAEISSKIKELCEQLSSLDPVEYSRVCTTEDDAPDWHKKLDRKLTDEQRKEAVKFGEIMSQCFETSGQECKCEEIPFTEFAEMCLIAAPLAVLCEVKGDETACEKMDNLEMPELPPHLQDVFDSLENDISESQFDAHMPRECQEAGAKSPKECMKIMVQTHAPEECRDAILEANVQNEREARAICEEIMFKSNAPEECIEAGLKDPRECGRFMFKSNAPEECIKAGLTGESRSDEKKCREIMESQNGGRREGFRRPEGGFGGANCRAIQDQIERLKCYDGASQGAQEHRENFESRFRETQEAQRQCAEKCLSQGSAWDFSNGQCRCRASERFDDSQFREQFSGPQPGQEFTEQPPTTTFGEETTTTPTTGTESTASGETATSSGSGSGASSDTSTSSGSGETSSPPTITASVISNNEFFNYYFK